MNEGAPKIYSPEEIAEAKQIILDAVKGYEANKLISNGAMLMGMPKEELEKENKVIELKLAKALKVLNIE